MATEARAARLGPFRHPVGLDGETLVREVREVSRAVALETREVAYEGAYRAVYTAVIHARNIGALRDAMYEALALAARPNGDRRRQACVLDIFLFLRRALVDGEERGGLDDDAWAAVVRRARARLGSLASSSESHRPLGVLVATYGNFQASVGAWRRCRDAADGRAAVQARDEIAACLHELAAVEGRVLAERLERTALAAFLDSPASERQVLEREVANVGMGRPFADARALP